MKNYRGVETTAQNMTTLSMFSRFNLQVAPRYLSRKHYGILLRRVWSFECFRKKERHLPIAIWLRNIGCNYLVMLNPSENL